MSKIFDGCENYRTLKQNLIKDLKEEVFSLTSNTEVHSEVGKPKSFWKSRKIIIKFLRYNCRQRILLDKKTN